MSDSVVTFSRPSAPQNRFWANGRRAHAGVEAREDVEDLGLLPEVRQRALGQVGAHEAERGSAVAGLREGAGHGDGVALEGDGHGKPPDNDVLPAS
jgi:hypothetical protein